MKCIEILEPCRLQDATICYKSNLEDSRGNNIYFYKIDRWEGFFYECIFNEFTNEYDGNTHFHRIMEVYADTDNASIYVKNYYIAVDGFWYPSKRHIIQIPNDIKYTKHILYRKF